MNKGSFREGFNQKGKESINRSGTIEVFLVCKAAIKNLKNAYEIIFYLKPQYLPHNEEQRSFIQDLPSQKDIPSFEAITGYLKNFSKSVKEVENMSLKNKTLLVVGYQR